jgi:phospho-N-acetylmuramoyl-pentapeptide-transferase
MLYQLAQWLRDYVSGFRLFTFITVRVGLAIVTALALSVSLGPVVIRLLKKFKIGQPVRNEEAPALHDLHQNKEGTPTMGGVLIVGATLLTTLLWVDLSNRLVWLVLGVVLWLGLLGFWDDYIKLRENRSLGLRAWPKFAGQLLCGLVLGIHVYNNPVTLERANEVDLILLKDLYLPMGIFYIPFVMLILCGTSNAVNLTDGLDGLAIGSVVMAAVAYGGMAYAVSHIEWSGYLHVPFVPGAEELTIFCAALVGAGLGFLWYNCSPAEIFMGDTGSLALGGALGTVAVLVKKELLLAIVGGLFVMEALSVILQVGSYKLRGKRIFLMAPIHHHFELKGWSETKVVVRFWIIAAMWALLSLGTLKVW